MIVFNSEIYLHKAHIEALKSEQEYVKKRYRVIAKTLAPSPFGISREKAAEVIGVCLRQLYRIVKRFRNEGIPGLRFKSTRPRNIKHRTPQDIEKRTVAVRKATGFGPRPVSDIVNESLKNEGRTERIYPSLTYNILVRNGEIEREKKIQMEWKRFEWGHPNRLIQADLTSFNGVQILTMEDDHARKGWALALKDGRDKTVIKGMKKLVKDRYDNLLTDNGSQFSRKNAEMRDYCNEFVNEKHIWTSIHHPQTMGKLSVYQKGLKRFLRHRLGRSNDLDDINRLIEVYNHWYNNGKYHSAIGTYPEMRYSGQRDNGWYDQLIEALKLRDALTNSAEG